MRLHLGSKQFTQHGRIARIREILIKVVFSEIEKCQQAGESSAFRLGFPTFGEFVHEVQNVVHG